MPKQDHLTDDQVAGMIRRFIEDGEITESLYDMVCRQAYILIKKRQIGEQVVSKEDAHSLAVDCLLELRTKRKTYIQSAGHLSHELSKYLTRRDSPAFHEVWKALSQALLELEKSGEVERVSSLGGANSQSTEWCLAGALDKPPMSIEDFLHSASGLPIYCPARKGGRLLAPTQARELVLNMLKLAGGPILMQDLHGEAMRHVVVQMLYPEPMDAGVKDYGGEHGISRHLADRITINDYILQEEARVRAQQIWDQLDKSGDCKTLCKYYIPKYMLSVPVSGSDLGDPRRISEAGKRICEAFQGVLDLSPTQSERQESVATEPHDPSGNDFVGYQARLLGRVADILINFCSEKSWDCSLNTMQGEP